MSEYLFGKNSVLAVLKAEPKRVFKILIAEGLKPDKRIDAIYAAAQEHGISIQKAPRQRLDQMINDPEANHQGVLASVAPKKLLTLYDLLDKAKARIAEDEYPLVLMLDEVTDPRNFGAILRVADAAGVDGVIVAKHHSPGFSPVVSKAASGADATVDVIVVSNLAQSLDALKEAGFWVVGAAGEADQPPYFRQDYAMPTVLVVGSEGQGLGRLIREKCDFMVRIPMHGSVDSLNVSAATAVLVFDIRARQPVKSGTV